MVHYVPTVGRNRKWIHSKSALDFDENILVNALLEICCGDQELQPGVRKSVYSQEPTIIHGGKPQFAVLGGFLEYAVYYAITQWHYLMIASVASFAASLS